MLMRIEKEIQKPKVKLQLIKKKKVLLIESYPEVLKKNRKLLKRMGYEVDTANSNKEMVKKSNEKYDAVFTRPYHKHVNAWMGARLFMILQKPPKIFICVLHPNKELTRFFKRCGVDEVLILPLDENKVRKVLN